MTEFYKESNKLAKQCEIIFASLDESKAEFEDYFKKMPWLAFPFEEKKLVSSLAQKFKVETVPSLILVDTNGEALSNDCRNIVASKGNQALTIFKEILANSLKNKST